jgi:hypothetical protein
MLLLLPLLPLPLLMQLFRNTQTDDGRGLNEPLNVTFPLNDTQWLFWSPDSPDFDDARTRMMQELNQPVMLGFAEPVAAAAEYAQRHALQASYLLAALPSSLHLQSAISLPMSKGGAENVLLRFMNTHASDALTFSLWHILPEHAVALVHETRYNTDVACMLYDSLACSIQLACITHTRIQPQRHV